ncbi:Selenocysteine lyase/Cysteine desulfurase [Nonlabens sp. Hel1_33_55]|uniref:aminotransferase class V-fold PLP-dependent enzyme n=1 Tax=Nonlabens sp. Hel1_33_55 TaxID=1336802 RepID=UPI000875C9D1|nr:aminotransferase class V-fold PLP-dependent enzyme [Nonlabens sp. Hel1_33_55]SCY38893.1 Selenocysteine lyase/Cysteine desulfurase [Nonlabens sp. Hel1_33_55]
MYNLKEHYPVLKDYTYLNTAAHGLISTVVADYKVSLNQELLNTASVFADSRGAFIDDVRTSVSSFIDAHYHMTALVPNFSMAFNALLEAIDKKNKFLLVKGDYPSVNWPVEARGFECCYADLNATLEENIWNACEQHKPDFLALSIVQYISGIRIDLEFLRKLKLQFPDLIIIADGTQFIGVEEFRFRESGIDILAASCYKWLNAGDGNAFMTFKEDVVDRIKPKYTGFNSVQGFKNDRGSFMGHFEPGHQDMTAFGGLQKAIEFCNEYGIYSIQNQIQTISQEARNEFTGRNLLQPEVTGRKLHSSIFNITGDEKLFEKLKNEKIIISQRGEGLRVSISYYNSIEDLNKLLNVIDEN